ncbi:MAG: hypothetical protein WBP93_12400 [Pyrinomonadaceae bacterium]
MYKNRPTTKEPTPMIDWPPPYGGAIPLPLGPTDNWWSVARKTGRINPWDMIQYNFQTTDPDVVNWCMFHLLKCRLVTKDKKNYRFGGKEDGTPVVIYVPSHSWEPPKEAPAGSDIPDRPEESFNDKLANVLVQTILQNHALGYINFGLSGYWINQTLFNAVRERINGGGIAVYARPSNGKAEYDSAINALFVPFSSAVTAKALILHECVHAGLDLLKAARIRVVDDEALAYISQCIYVSKNKAANPEIRTVGDDEDWYMNQVFDKAWAIAMILIRGEVPSTSDYDALRSALLATPKYGHGYDYAAYNGIGW